MALLTTILYCTVLYCTVRYGSLLVYGSPVNTVCRGSLVVVVQHMVTQDTTVAPLSRDTCNEMIRVGKYVLTLVLINK